MSDNESNVNNVDNPEILVINTKSPTLNKNGQPRAARGTGKRFIKATDGKTQGWHKRLYFKDLNGNHYSHGKLITDSIDINYAMDLQTAKDAKKTVAV